MGRLRLACDIETDDLLEKVSKIWCIGAVDLDSKEEFLFHGDSIEDGIALLDSAKVLVFHNMRFDLEVFKKLYNKNYYSKTLDTLIMSKIKYPFKRTPKGARSPYSLKAFGINFKFPKGDYNDWSKYTDEMGQYCLQDCRVTRKIFHKLDNDNYEFDADWNRLEHDFAELQQNGVNVGVWLDEDLRLKTLSEIQCRMAEIQESVSDILGYAYNEKIYNLKKDGNLPHHAVKLIDKIEVSMGVTPKVQFNKLKTKCRVLEPVKITLDTKKLLISRLRELGWVPVFYTEPSTTHPDGQPQLVRDGEVDPNLQSMSDEYKEFSEYFMLKHRKSLIEGFKKITRADGKVSSEADTVGAVTGRATHRGIANFPAVRSAYGDTIRSMFGVEPNKKRVFVGSDLAGIEARLLAHYMDDADFTDTVLNGDIHSFNQEMAGLPTRDDAKTFFYGFMYGAGDAKVGSIIGGSAKAGKAIKAKFLNSLPKLADIIETKQEEARKGYITVLGGRPVMITKSKGYDGNWGYDVRKALNSLLQGSGAIYFKKWAVVIGDKIKEQGLDADIVILYHDEVQIDCAEKDVDALKAILKEAVKEADAYFDVNCKNDIETKVGQTWYDTH